MREVYGGADAYSELYGKVGSSERKQRLAELDGALEEYSGDPADRREFEKYEALKEEAEWLRAHPDN